MDLTVREHIRRLEERQQEIAFQLMNENNKQIRNTLDAELRAVNLALTHYRAALEI